MSAPAAAPDPVAAQVSEVVLWYHTLELPGGVVTPGNFDLRQMVHKLPWPEVKGKRCLDVATYDGFYAFELERRGAAEVIATDIPHHADWDWPASARGQNGSVLAEIAGEKGRGFELAREALGSRVQKRTLNVYHLSPDDFGTFDVVVCGSLLLHLRDPVRALEAIRSVCRPDGWFLSVEAVSLWLSKMIPHRPVAELCPDDNRCQWWTVNKSGHQRLLEVAGFEVTQRAGVFCEPFGAAHPVSINPPKDPRSRAIRAGRKLLTGDYGVPHAALLAHPRLQAPPIKL